MTLCHMNLRRERVPDQCQDVDGDARARPSPAQPGTASENRGAVGDLSASIPTVQGGSNPTINGLFQLVESAFE